MFNVLLTRIPEARDVTQPQSHSKSSLSCVLDAAFTCVCVCVSLPEVHEPGQQGPVAFIKQAKLLRAACLDTHTADVREATQAHLRYASEHTSNTVRKSLIVTVMVQLTGLRLGLIKSSNQFQTPELTGYIMLLTASVMVKMATLATARRAR